MKDKRWFRTGMLGALAGVVALGGLGGLTWGVWRPAAADEPAAAERAARPALAVTVAVPQAETLPVRLSANGDVAAWQEAVIGSDVAELRLIEVRADVGDVVRAGQVLAVFDDATVRADVAQARAALAEARAAATEAADNARRARDLRASGALAQQQVTQYLTAEQTAQARVEAAQAALDAQALRLKRTRVLAPDDGVVSARSATVGAVSGMGGELFRLVRQGRLEWRAEVASATLPRIRIGVPVRVLAANGEQVDGLVRMVAPTVDTQKRSALVYVDLPPLPLTAAGAQGEGREGNARHAAVLPGMFARGDFLLGEQAALTVPQAAVVVRDGYSYVFVLGDDSHVAMRRVQTGTRIDGRVAVLDGLVAAERVVARGGVFLNDGDLVRVEPAADAVTETTAAGAAR